ncbi:MAG TPA: transcription elongation factor GreA [Actinomycetota bacterium]|nr:transcription elongation factor GreA [Actinomycetota bacterium]
MNAEAEPRFRRNPGDQPTAVLTTDAYQRLRSELDRLKGEGREEIAERLLRAREHGDIRENAEYDAAKNEQGLMEARIRELEALLKDPDIVEGPVTADQVGPGVLVTVRPDEDGEDEETYLVAASKEERLPGVRTVTADSPLGSALLGRRVGDRVSYEAPGGTFGCEIVRLEPRS